MTSEFLGYPVPIDYAADLEVSSIWFAVTYDGSTYIPSSDSVPFTTTSTFDATKWVSIQGVTASDLASSSGANIVGFIQDGTGAVQRTMQSKARDIVSVYDFGVVADGATDDTSAHQAAQDYAYSVGASLIEFVAGQSYSN